MSSPSYLISHVFIPMPSVFLVSRTISTAAAATPPRSRPAPDSTHMLRENEREYCGNLPLLGRRGVIVHLAELCVRRVSSVRICASYARATPPPSTPDAAAL